MKSTGGKPTRVICGRPADIKKSGTAFDLPIAMGILAATNQLRNPEALQHYVIMGELSLDGEIRPIKGALPIAIQARKEKFKGLFVSTVNAREAAIANNLNVYSLHHIKEVIDFLKVARPACSLYLSIQKKSSFIRNTILKLIFQR